MDYPLLQDHYTGGLNFFFLCLRNRGDKDRSAGYRRLQEAKPGSLLILDLFSGRGGPSISPSFQRK